MDKDKIKQLMGYRLTSFRNHIGVSQRKFTELIGYSKISISRWESGSAFIPTEAIITISSIYGEQYYEYFNPFKKGPESHFEKQESTQKTPELEPVSEQN